MVACIVHKGICHAQRHGVVGRNIRGGPFIRDRALDMRGHAHSDTKSMCAIRSIVGISSQTAQ
jgi:hypothetical protein